MTATATVRHKVLVASARIIGSAPAVLVTTVAGAKYQLRHAFADLAAADRMVDRVLAKGSIDPAHWDIVGVQPASRAEAHLRAKSAAEQARHAAHVEARLAA